MNDRPISVTVTCAALLWAGGGALIVVYALVGVRGLGVIGIFLSAGAATLTIRCYLMQLAECFEHRERNAFELGRDSMRVLRD